MAASRQVCSVASDQLTPNLIYLDLAHGADINTATVCGGDSFSAVRYMLSNTTASGFTPVRKGLLWIVEMTEILPI